MNNVFMIYDGRMRMNILMSSAVTIFILFFAFLVSYVLDVGMKVFSTFISRCWEIVGLL